MLFRCFLTVISITICLDVLLPEEICRALPTCEESNVLTSELSDLDEENEAANTALMASTHLRISHFDFLHIPGHVRFDGNSLQLARAPPAIA